jgi:hypothetical protein
MDRASPEPTRTPERGEDLHAPGAANTVAVAALVALSAAFLFASYCMARALAGGFGAGFGTIALATLATMAAAIFLWWFVPFADFAEIVWVHLPADRRAREARCPHCGYPHEERPVCTECGRSTEPLPAWALSMRPVRRLAWILVPALVVGVAAGEAWSRLDESRFADEARAAGGAYARKRAFPAAFAQMTSDGAGSFASEAWSDFTRDRRWKPADESRRVRGLGWRADDAESDGRETTTGATVSP